MTFNFFNIMLSRIDLFGKAVEFNFNGGAKSRTRIGGVFSMLFFGFWIWAIYDVGLDIFQRKNPSTLTTEAFSENPAQMTINPYTFSFAFGVEDPVYESHYINESIYTISVTLKHMRRKTASDGSVELDWTFTTLETETCTESHFGDLSSNFANLQLDSLYCLKKNQPDIDAVTIQGMYESDAFDYLQISVKECSNATSNDTCGTQDELDAMLGGGGFFAIYYSNIAIDSEDYSNPTIGYRDSAFTMFGNNYYKQLYMWLNHLDIVSDSGWLVESEHTDSFIKPGSIDETVTLKNMSSMLDYQIRVSKVSTVYNRSYIKVQDIAAQANGLTSVVLVLMLIFVTPYSNLKFYESLINALFDVKTLKKDSSMKKSKKKQKKNNKETKKDPEESQDDKTNKKMFEMSHIPLEESITHHHQIVIDSPKYLLKSERVKEEMKTSAKKSIKPEKVLTSLEKIHELKISHNISSHDDSGDSDGNSVDEKRPKRFSPRKASRKHSGAETENYSSNPKILIRGPKTSPKSYYKKSKSEVESFGTHMLLDRPAALKPNSKGIEEFDSQDLKSIDDILKSVVIDVKTNKDDLKPMNLDLTSSPQEEKLTYELVEKNHSPDLGDKTPHGLHRISSDLSAEPSRLNITFWDYIRSFVRRSDAMKEKMRLLNEGINRINERLDIFQMFKKFREIDKLKVLLLDYNQQILFEGIPRPQLILRDDDDDGLKDSKKISKRQLQEAKFVNEKKKYQNVLNAYANIKTKEKSQSTIIDKRLMDIYDEEDENN